MVEGDGFEPSKAEPADLQSAPLATREPLQGVFILRTCFPNTLSKCFSQLIQRIITRRIWWRGTDSNHRRRSRQIYSLLPLATREPLQGVFILRTCFPNTLSKCFSQLIQRIITRRNMVEGDGFEPSKAEPADLQSAPFGHSGTPPGYFPNLIWIRLKRCFPNASLKCGAHHSKPVQCVKPFSVLYMLNAAFLGKDARKYTFW